MAAGPEALLRWVAPDGPWTEPDLHHFPQDGHRYEIVDGGLHVTPPLDRTHESVVAALVTALRTSAPAGWWAASRMGIQIDRSNLVPDVTVLRPGSSGAVWIDPRDVALVVEVESPATRRYDRTVKPAIYAEAAIESFWRIELVATRALAHLYTRPAGGHYQSHRLVHPGQQLSVERPFDLPVTPARWTP